MTADKPDLMRATPRPWILLEHNDDGLWDCGYITTQDRLDRKPYPRVEIASVSWHYDGEAGIENRANAALIVEAVNAYDRHLALIDTLTKALGEIAHGYWAEERHELMEVARAALKLAKESGNG